MIKLTRPTDFVLVRPGKYQKRLTSIELVTLVQAVSVFGIFFIMGMAALSIASPVAAPVAAGIVTGLLLGPLASKLERRGVPSYLVATMALLTVIFLLGLAIFAFAPSFDGWVQRAPDIISAIKLRFDSFQRALLRLQDSALHTSSANAPVPVDASNVIMPNLTLLKDAALTAPSILGQIVLYAGTVFFYTASRLPLRAGVISICRGRRAKLTAARIIRDMEHQVSTYLGTITLINAGLGVATMIMAWLFGLQNPAFWGVLAALLNFVPYLGPATFTLVLIGVGFISYTSLSQALLPALAFICITIIEGQILTPALIGHRFTINPLLIFLALAFWIWLWGPIGGLLATPFLIMMMVIFLHIV